MVEDLKSNRPDRLTDVTVNFALDVNGILDVSVLERKTGKLVSERLKANRQRLSPEQISESQAKLAEVYAASDEEEEVEAVTAFDPGVSALLERASGVLERPDLDAQLASEISGVIADIHRANAEDDTDRVEELCDELIDLIMEAES
jgi:molecular chaperone DnaK (HSP70)